MLLDTGKYKRLSRASTSNAYRRTKPRSASVPWRGVGRMVGRTVVLSLSLVMGLAFLAALSVGLLYAYRWTTNNTYFSLRNIQVLGNERLSSDEVLAEAGVSLGDNALALKIREVEGRLAAVPWIENVSVKRILPAACTITLTEREPRYWVQSENGLYYADERGRSIAPVDTNKFQSFPLLKIDEGGEELLDRLPVLVADLSRVLPLDVAKADWIRLNSSRGMEIRFADNGVRVLVDIADWNGNLERLGLVWADLKSKGELQAVERIMAHGSNVWVDERRFDEPA